jgi:hypothetical protein
MDDGNNGRPMDEEDEGGGAARNLDPVIHLGMFRCLHLLCNSKSLQF